MNFVKLGKIHINLDKIVYVEKREFNNSMYPVIHLINGDEMVLNVAYEDVIHILYRIQNE